MEKARSAWKAVCSALPTVKRGLGFAFVWALLTHYSFATCCWLLLLASLAGALAGALGGYLSWRGGSCRDLRLFRHDAAIRGAGHGATATWGFVLFINIAAPWTLGAVLGFLGGVTGAFLSKAEQSFAQAVGRLSKGDREGARKSIEEYLQHAGDDPARAARLPVAERFLQDDQASLDVSAELEAASAPQGRGTELEGASAPAGRGSELQAETAPAGRGSELQAETAPVARGSEVQAETAPVARGSEVQAETAPAPEESRVTGPEPQRAQ